ncbi:MAG: DUF881 domain-containing protein [Actinobacteria bacterium]|nr:DUF881 domain-containing protein [Actinomycetota bacterium]
MTLITEMMQRPLDPGYAAAAERRQEAGLPPATGRHGPMLVIITVLIGALLGTSALALRAPTATVSRIKLDLVGRIEAKRAHADAQTRLITALRNEINTAQAASLSQQSQTGLTAEISKLELSAGTVPVTGPGLVLTIDDAKTKADPNNPDAGPGTSTGPDQGKVIAKDLQIIVNGLWAAGAEAISVNGHRLTSRAAIRFAGEAILVDYRPLTRPYVITAIGDPSSLSVEFADNSGGSYLHSLTNNYQVRSNIQNRASVVVPGAPALSVQRAQPVQSAVTKQSATRTHTTPEGTTTTTTPQTTEASP